MHVSACVHAHMYVCVHMTFTLGGQFIENDHM